MWCLRAPSTPIFLAAGLALPGATLALAHVHLSAPAMAAVAGTSIMCAAFLLVWACDAAQRDVSQSLALAAVALIAVLPEYAVDMYFTWMAGRFPHSDYASYAIANMTGANRLIIGVAWGVVVLIFWLKTRAPIALEADRLLEVRFLAAATCYALVIPIKGSLTWFDGLVFVGLFAWYVLLAARRPLEEEELTGPAACIACLPCAPRRLCTILLFLFAGAVIFVNAEPFCEGLVRTGKQLGINEFLLVQWLAPLASETPEFVIAIVFAVHLRGSMALGTLLSSKLNQWTLLVGMIPAVYAISAGTLAHSLPLGHFQMQEIFLTAAQSALAVIMLAPLSLSLGQAALLFALFSGQLVGPSLVDAWLHGQIMGIRSEQLHVLFALLYLVAAVSVAVHEPHRLYCLLPAVRRRPVPELGSAESSTPESYSSVQTPAAQHSDLASL